MNKQKIKNLERSLNSYVPYINNPVKIEMYNDPLSYKLELERRKIEGKTEKENSNSLFPERIDILVCKTREDVELFRALKK